MTSRGLAQMTTDELQRALAWEDSKRLRTEYPSEIDRKAYNELIDDILTAKIPQIPKDTDSKVSIDKPTSSFLQRIQESKLLVIGAEYGKSEEKKWSNIKRVSLRC